MEDKSEYFKALERVIKEAPKAMRSGCEKYAWLRKTAGAQASDVLCSPDWFVIAEEWDKEQKGKRDGRGFRLLADALSEIEKKRKKGGRLEPFDLQVISSYNSYELKLKSFRERFAQTLCERVREEEAAERDAAELKLKTAEAERKAEMQKLLLGRLEVEIKRIEIAIEVAKEKLSENPEEAQELLNPRIMSLEEALDMLSGFKELPQ